MDNFSSSNQHPYPSPFQSPLPSPQIYPHFQGVNPMMSVMGFGQRREPTSIIQPSFHRHSINLTPTNSQNVDPQYFWDRTSVTVSKILYYGFVPFPSPKFVPTPHFSVREQIQPPPHRCVGVLSSPMFDLTLCSYHPPHCPECISFL
jgi:hypothetical protein